MIRWNWVWERKLNVSKGGPGGLFVMCLWVNMGGLGCHAIDSINVLLNFCIIIEFLVIETSCPPA